MVKKLIISSGDTLEDRKAAMIVSKVLMEKEVEGVVWYSSLADSLALIAPMCQKVAEHEGTLGEVMGHLKSLVDAYNALSDLIKKYIRLHEAKGTNV